MTTDIEKQKLPPNQRSIKDFPVLDLGIYPKIDMKSWRFTVDGDIDNPFSLRWDEFMALPKVELVTDFHCVTGWSRFDNKWEGVLFKTIAEKAKPKPSVKHIYLESSDGYSTNMPLEVAMDDDVLLAFGFEEKPLEYEHGGPLRLIVPKKYAYKSAKWVIKVTFLAQEKLGYWELRGYSNSADPWKEERYS